jgi:hypothetical protein
MDDLSMLATASVDETLRLLAACDVLAGGLAWQWPPRCGLLAFPRNRIRRLCVLISGVCNPDRLGGITMNRAITAVAAIVLFSPCPLYALYEVENRGSWPESWPKELEGLREQSRTLVGPEVLLRHYAIPFAQREAFEAVWLHLLKVTSPGAPIVLRRAPSFWLGDESKAGVCIHTPPESEAPLADAKKANGHREQTIYIELIVDGEIVDLNRIPLPPDTPIIDERFKDGASKP